MSSYMAGVFDLDLDVDSTVGDSDDDDIIEVDEVCDLYSSINYTIGTPNLK